MIKSAIHRMWMWMCVCVCVCERETEFMCVCVCLCVFPDMAQHGVVSVTRRSFMYLFVFMFSPHVFSSHIHPFILPSVYVHSIPVWTKTEQASPCTNAKCSHWVTHTHTHPHTHTHAHTHTHTHTLSLSV